MSPAAAAKAAKYGEFPLWPAPLQEARAPIPMSHACPAHGTPEDLVHNVSSPVSILTPLSSPQVLLALEVSLEPGHSQVEVWVNSVVVLRSAWL